MKFQNINAFKDSLIYYRHYIFIPRLDVRIDKNQFIIDGKYDFQKEEDYLEEIYNKHN